MKINITGKNVVVTEPMREYTETKLNKILDNFPNITSIHVSLDVVKVTQIAEATLHIPHHQIHAKAESEDLYAAIDALEEKLNKQLVKHKQKDGHH